LFRTESQIFSFFQHFFATPGTLPPGAAEPLAHPSSLQMYLLTTRWKL